MSSGFNRKLHRETWQQWLKDRWFLRRRSDKNRSIGLSGKILLRKEDE